MLVKKGLAVAGHCLHIGGMIIIRHRDGGSASEWLTTHHGHTAGRSSAQPGGWNRLATRWHAVVNFLVPSGYEDNTGFHFSF